MYIKLGLFACTLLLLSSCKKENTQFQNTYCTYPNMVNPPRPMIKTYTHWGRGRYETAQFVYDSDWNVIYADSLFYCHYKDSVTMKPHWGWNYLSYYLNAKGLAFQEVYSNGVISNTYTYDVNGYLSQSTWAAGGSSYQYDIDSNLIRQDFTATNDGNVGGHLFFSYSNDVNTIGNYNMGKYFLGKSSRNLQTIWGQLVIDLNTNDTLSLTRADFTYSFNNRGWVDTVRYNSIYIDYTTERDTQRRSDWSSYTYY